MYRMASAGIYFADGAAVRSSDLIVVLSGPCIVALSAWFLTLILACFLSRRFCLALSPLNFDISSPSDLLI
jgi:hypothetical protein